MRTSGEYILHFTCDSLRFWIVFGIALLWHDLFAYATSKCTHHRPRKIGATFKWPDALDLSLSFGEFVGFFPSLSLSRPHSFSFCLHAASFRSMFAPKLSPSAPFLRPGLAESHSGVKLINEIVYFRFVSLAGRLPLCPSRSLFLYYRI